MIIETCIATGARISEVLGLKWTHVNLVAGTIKIEQRVWHQEISRPKSDGSRRILGIGNLVERFAADEQAVLDAEQFVFQQKNVLENRCGIQG